LFPSAELQLNARLTLGNLKSINRFGPDAFRQMICPQELSPAWFIPDDDALWVGSLSALVLQFLLRVDRAHWLLGIRLSWAGFADCFLFCSTKDAGNKSAGVWLSMQRRRERDKALRQFTRS
jgi:hypothetical protein